MKRLILFVECILAILISSMIVNAGDEMALPHPPPIPPAPPDYTGIYRCTDTSPSAGRLLLKVEKTNFTYLLLPNVFDVTSAQEEQPELKMGQPEVCEKANEVQSITIRGRGEFTFKKKMSSAGKSAEEWKSLPRSFEFKIQWIPAIPPERETICLSLLDDTGDAHVLHFEKLPAQNLPNP